MLLVDVGNSAATLGAWTPPDGAQDGRLEPVHVAVTAPVSLAVPPDGEGRRRLAQDIAAAGRRLGRSGAAVASVVPEIDAFLRDVLPDAWHVDHAASFPFALAVADPTAVGADRYCNMAAAAGMGWAGALVVDAGTATTFDVLEAGAFVGGLIAPGIGLAADALGGRAARLPRVAPAAASARPAPDTAGALAAGAFLTGVHGIAGTVDALLAACGDRPVVLTGGQSPLLLEARPPLPGPAAWRHDPLWTLRGLALLARLNGRAA